MNWLTSLLKNKVKSGNKLDTPQDLWCSCNNCKSMVHKKELKDTNFCCPFCGFHFYMPSEYRFKSLFDNGKYDILKIKKVTQEDPLHFIGKESYAVKIKKVRKIKGKEEAIEVAYGKCNSKKVVIVNLDFSFMGGSMGRYVGESIVQAALFAQKHGYALISITSSGGARMQEGVFSLVQMARTTAAIEKLKESKLPYIVLLTNPSTGGVLASLAMIGDIHIAEPKAVIGFSGRRVIEQTVKEILSDDFQTAEYLLDHGMVDMVVARDKQRKKIGLLLNMLMNNNADFHKVKNNIQLGINKEKIYSGRVKHKMA